MTPTQHASSHPCRSYYRLSQMSISRRFYSLSYYSPSIYTSESAHCSNSSFVVQPDRRNWDAYVRSKLHTSKLHVGAESVDGKTGVSNETAVNWIMPARCYGADLMAAVHKLMCILAEYDGPVTEVTEEMEALVVELDRAVGGVYRAVRDA